MEHTKENRRHKRLFFAPAEKVTARVSFNDSHDKVQIMVLDVSESGIGLSLNRGEASQVVPGQHFSMSCLEGWADINFDPSIVLEVKWVLDHEFLGRIAFGCEFKDLPELYRNQLCQMIG